MKTKENCLKLTFWQIKIFRMENVEIQREMNHKAPGALYISGR